MIVMSAPVEATDLLDLKFVPAWVKEPGAKNDYGHYAPEQQPGGPQSRNFHGQRRERAPRSRQPRSDGLHPRPKLDRSRRDRMQKPEGGRPHSDRAKRHGVPDRHSLAALKPPE